MKTRRSKHRSSTDAAAIVGEVAGGCHVIAFTPAGTDGVIVGIDPSSTTTGYARMTLAGELVDAGRFIAPRKDTPLRRILYMRQAVAELVRGVPAVVIEITTGKVAARHRGGGAGLAVYGMAVGAILVEAEHVCDNVLAVTENVWTEGVRKMQRRREIAVMFPAYSAIVKRDPGGDVSDAIGLCLWWLRQHRAPTHLL